MKKRRVMLIALDACDKDLLIQWAEDGTLPTIQRLRDTGLSGICESPPGLFVGAVWPSFWTSRSPAVHARYCYEQLNPGTYDDVGITPYDTKSPPWWTQISEAGRRVSVVDIPKTHPTRHLNGIHIVDWGTHDPDHATTITWPEELAQEVEGLFGRETMRNCNPYAESPERLAELAGILQDRITRKTDLLLHYLAQEPWDCFLAAFSDTHCVGHQCWHLQDPTDVNYSEEAARIAGNPMKDVYIAIDGAIARVLDVVGDDVDVVILASHGFRSHYDATFMMDEILKRIERPRATPRPKATSMAKRAWMTLPAGARSFLRPLKTRARVELGVAERASRKYFAIPNNDACGAIRVNLAGREPQGRVAPADFDSVCDMLRAELMSLVNVETGERVVRDVKRSDELYEGPNMNHLPDLLVFWNHNTPVTLIESPRTGRIADRYNRGRTGDHTPLGMFFYRAPDGKPGKMSHTVSIMDFGPTIAERLGVTLSNVDGTSFADAVSDGLVEGGH